jgi:hypothetical protein
MGPNLRARRDAFAAHKQVVPEHGLSRIPSFAMTRRDARFFDATLGVYPARAQALDIASRRMTAMTMRVKNTHLAKTLINRTV